MSLRDKAFMAGIRRLPRQQLTKGAGVLSGLPVPKALRTPVYGLFAQLTGANMNESAAPYEDFPTFNAFFTRELREGVRPWMAASTDWAMPADGTLSVQGRVKKGEMIQVKGIHYDVGEFLGTPIEPWENARYATIYLSPAEYHRVHWPTDGQVHDIQSMGCDLWPVNRASVHGVPQLFVENERTVTQMIDAAGRPAAVVMVGATVVGGISLAVPSVSDGERVNVQAGQEHGKFFLGSTVVLVVQDAEHPLTQEHGKTDSMVQVGQALWSS